MRGTRQPTTSNSKTISFLLRLENNLYVQLTKSAEKRGATKSGIIRILIEEFLKREQRRDIAL